ncbi:unnamed protein product [Pleuronectes platessa]|uniref:Uncharacterized protein n=1 Tax=Pleuronectes platessa TaxID=8262 RepID=A0A9N7YLV6_PLEPL|nr:unnamed protein product [Pleuronectes platessa]
MENGSSEDTKGQTWSGRRKQELESGAEENEEQIEMSGSLGQNGQAPAARPDLQHVLRIKTPPVCPSTEPSPALPGRPPDLSSSIFSSTRLSAHVDLGGRTGT